VNHERISGGVALSGVARSSRRRLLTLLAALPAALGFSFVMERESVTAWKEQAQRKRQGVEVVTRLTGKSVPSST
jgi:hypothetical protein